MSETRRFLRPEIAAWAMTYNRMLGVAILFATPLWVLILAISPYRLQLLDLSLWLGLLAVYAFFWLQFMVLAVVGATVFWLDKPYTPKQPATES